MTKEEKIQAKKNEIANYERILNNYRGRWYWYGRRKLDELNDELNDELKELEKEGPETGPSFLTLS